MNRPENELLAEASRHCGTLPSPVTVMQARHLSGAGFGKLIEWEVGRGLNTGKHQRSPAAALGAVTYGGTKTTLWIDWDHDHDDEVELDPDAWVRVAQLPAGKVST